jgi:hypothetical protein
VLHGLGLIDSYHTLQSSDVIGLAWSWILPSIQSNVED